MSAKENERLQRALIDFASNYLQRTGWFESIRQGQAVDREGPVPWYTYPAIRALQCIVKPEYQVFEYGAGNSSLWWANRSAEVVSVEHDSGWVQQVLKCKRDNQEIIEMPINSPVEDEHREYIEEGFINAGYDPVPSDDHERNLRAGLLSQPFMAYAAQLMRFPKGYFDVVIVDGMARVLTAWIAAQWVREDGFVVFDNSDREDYAKGYELLGVQGFRRIDYWGPGPLNSYEWCTSVFTRTTDIYA